MFVCACPPQAGLQPLSASAARLQNKSIGSAESAIPRVLQVPVSLSELLTQSQDRVCIKNLLGGDRILDASEESFSKPQECSGSPHLLFCFVLSLGWVTGSNSRAGSMQPTMGCTTEVCKGAQRRPSLNPSPATVARRLFCILTPQLSSITGWTS